MFEVSVVNEIMRTCERHNSKYDGERIVKKISMKIGALSNLNPSDMIKYFKIATKGSLLESVILHVEKDKAYIKCYKCGSDSELTKGEVKCSKCDNEFVYIIAEDSYYVVGIEWEKAM